MTERSAATSIDDYIAEFPAEVQARLQEIRSLVHEIAPDAVETIAYAIPTFDLGGRHLVHFAAFTNHVGLYPTPSGMVAFADDLAPFKGGKGSARFPLAQPLPIDLIRRIVEFRVAEETRKD